MISVWLVVWSLHDWLCDPCMNGRNLTSFFMMLVCSKLLLVLVIVHMIDTANGTRGGNKYDVDQSFNTGSTEDVWESTCMTSVTPHNIQPHKTN